MQSKILIVDDDRFIRRLLKDLLEEGGFQVCEAVDGEDACRVAELESPAAIIMDLVMPNVDGAVACRRLRDNPRFRFIPILMLTSRTDLQGSVNPFHVGADDYISKPFDGFDLLARLQGNLVKNRTLQALECQARDYQTLLEIADSIASSLDTGDILRQIVNRIATHIEGVVRCSIALIQKDERTGYVLASSDNADLSEVRLDLENYPEIRQVMEQGKSLHIVDIHSDPLMAEVLPLLQDQKFNTILVLPVHFRGSVIGVMIVRASRDDTNLTDKEINFCQLVADVSAGPLQNARYYRNTCEESDLLKRAKERLEQELRTKQIYEVLFENASDGLLAITPTGSVEFANLRAQQIVGLTREDLRDRSIDQLLGRRTVQRLLVMKRRNDLNAAVQERFDVRIPLPNETTRILSVTVNPQLVADDLMVLSFRDVTEKRQLEQELLVTKNTLEAANRDLEQLDQLRDEFINTATHELRVPVTIVHGYCSLLLEMGIDNLTEQQLEFLQAANASSEKLVDLVNNMLDLSRFQAGKMHLDLVEGDIGRTVSRVCSELSALATRQGLRLSHVIENSKPALFDPASVERVLTNLVGNAIKFTPSGGEILVQIDEQPLEVCVTVSDTGKGIPSENLKQVFDEFTQVGREDSHKGSGLGLAICKKIVDSHGGRIWVESEPGLGSRFNFTLLKPQ